MSKVQELETTIQKLGLNQAEMQQVRDWLDDLIEEDLELSPEFEAKVQAAERDMAAGSFTRTRGGTGL
ncbi:MAG: hypothetical protein HZA89_08605 [Verrucomicrobia bacterium]|nr:hypothetical protein [Verrucomicrobiota bacterium]